MSSESVEALCPVAGFWRRAGAFVLDSLIMAAVGAAVGMVLFDALAGLGSYGSLLGFAVSLIYHGLLNSALCGGQTLGKRLLGIKVVGRDGEILSSGRSLLRTAVLLGPYYINPSELTSAAFDTAFNTLLSEVFFGLLLVTAYLIVFNRGTRQSLHDLVVGSFVVPADSVGSILVPRVWRWHWVAAVLLCLGAGAVGELLQSKTISSEVAALLSTARSISEKPGIYGVSINTLYRTGNARKSVSGPYEVFNIKFAVKDKQQFNQHTAKEVVRLVISKDPTVTDVDLINVTVIYGYDLGFSSGWLQTKFSFSPTQWLED